MTKRFSEENVVIFHDADINTDDIFTNVNGTNWIDMSRHHKITVLLFRTVGTGAASAGLYVSAAATGTSAALVGSAVTTISATGLLNAADGSISKQGVGLILLEANSDEIAAALEGGRYVCARLLQDTATDEFGCLYILGEPRYQQASLVVSGESADP